MSQNRKKRYSIGSILNRILVPLILPVVIIIAWQLLSDFGVVESRLLPSPVRVWEELCEMWGEGTLLDNLAISGQRVGIGFLIGGGAGLILGILTGLFSWLDRSLSAIVGALRPIPMVAWIPLFILWLGIDEAPKIAVIAVGSFWPILINTAQGIKNVDLKYLEVAKILEKSKSQILFKVVWPASMPSVLTGLRLGISSAWNCVVTAEMIAASAGVGYMITQGRQYYNVSQVLVGVALIGVVGLILDVVLIWLEDKLLQWNMQDKN